MESMPWFARKVRAEDVNLKFSGWAHSFILTGQELDTLVESIEKAVKENRVERERFPRESDLLVKSLKELRKFAAKAKSLGAGALIQVEP